MGDVMGKKSGRMNGSTYSAVQIVKYSLNAKTSNTFKPKPVQLFQRLDRIKSSVISSAIECVRRISKETPADITAEKVTKNEF